MKDLKKVIGAMTLEEKAGLCSGKNFWYLKGIERLGIPSIMMTDGPHGLRKQEVGVDHAGLHESVPATCFPTASALAATWNRDLLYQVGVALGEECRQEKVGVILGPGINIKRSPLCGRNFEYFSEDPYLTGEMAKSYIKGVQSQGVGTSLKHYAVNNQEYRRMTIDTVVDERALREIYLTGFEIAVKESQPWTVMCAYNKVNGTYACEDNYLLTAILKKEWGHTGLVVTDWGAMNDCLAALQAGLELEMPGVNNGNTALIIKAVQAGALDEITLDRAVERILQLIFRVAEKMAENYSCDMPAHHALARKVAAEGAVLLKNEGSLLPLAEETKIALIGRFARQPRYQGAGSSLMNPTQLDNLYTELAVLVGEENLFYSPGYSERGDSVDEALIADALKVAGRADVVVVCAGLTDLFEVEGLDRPHMKLPAGHDALIARLAAVHQKVVVVLSNGSPVEMPWGGDVSAILEGYLGGQAGAGALADILTGRINPSGKLAETFPFKESDCPARPFPGGPAAVEYRESIYVGYRYYDTVQQEVLFPFGYGLSYTTFAYSNLELHRSGEQVKAVFRIKNNGAVRGKEIAQVYVKDLEATTFRPEKELKGFAKVELEAGEEKEVTIDLDRRAFAFYDCRQSDWIVEAGQFEILVGASSRDIRLRTTIDLEGEQLEASSGEKTDLAAYFNPTQGEEFTRADFAALLGRPLQQQHSARKGEYTLNTPVCELGGSFAGRFFIRIVESQIRKMIRGKEETPTALLLREMIVQMPLRGLLMQGGILTRSRLEALLLVFNGHSLKGLKSLFRPTSSNQAN